MSNSRTFLVITSPSMEALYVIFDIFRDFLQSPSQKCWDRRTCLKGSRLYVLRKQELLMDASWCNGLGFNTRPLGSFGLLIPSKEIMGFLKRSWLVPYKRMWPCGGLSLPVLLFSRSRPLISAQSWTFVLIIKPTSCTNFSNLFVE